MPNRDFLAAAGRVAVVSLVLFAIAAESAAFVIAARVFAS